MKTSRLRVAEDLEGRGLMVLASDMVVVAGGLLARISHLRQSNARRNGLEVVAKIGWNRSVDSIVMDIDHEVQLVLEVLADSVSRCLHVPIPR